MTERRESEQEQFTGERVGDFLERERESKKEREREREIEREGLTG